MSSVERWRRGGQVCRPARHDPILFGAYEWPDRNFGSFLDQAMDEAAVTHDLVGGTGRGDGRRFTQAAWRGDRFNRANEVNWVGIKVAV
jgi:hypothetical protein